MFKNIVERVSMPLAESTIDEKSRILYGVVVANTRESQNGYTYSDKSFDSLTRLIGEGANAFIDHPSREKIKHTDGVRSIEKLAGVFKSPKREGDKITSNLHLGERFWPLFKDIIELQPQGVGLSINSRVKVYVENGKESILDVDKLHSIDLVSSSSLTAGLFESYDPQNTGDPSTMEEVQQTSRESLSLQSATVKEIKEHAVIVEGDHFKSEIDLKEFDKTPAVGEEIEVVIEDRMEIKTEIKTEGIIADEIKQDEIRSRANELLWKAKSMISTVLQDKEIKQFSERKKKIIAVLDDLEKELGKILPKIEPTEDEEVENMALSEKAIKGLESIGQKAQEEEDRESILGSVRFGRYGGDREDDPITKQENERMRDAEKEKERRESRADNITDSDREEILASVGI